MMNKAPGQDFCQPLPSTHHY